MSELHSPKLDMLQGHFDATVLRLRHLWQQRTMPTGRTTNNAWRRAKKLCVKAGYKLQVAQNEERRGA